MIDSYHLAIERLTSIDAPVVAAVRGGAGGGGLGLLYAADIVVAADDARFALGYGRARPDRPTAATPGSCRAWSGCGARKSCSCSTAASPRRKRSTSDWCRVWRRAISVESEAAALAATLAAGPTRAFGAVRRMLRQSFETGLSDQLDAEKESIVVASSTDDAQEGIAAFVAKRRPQFRGRLNQIRTDNSHQLTADTAARFSSTRLHWSTLDFV